MDQNARHTFHLPLLIEQDEDGVYIISCPSFQGCHSYGKTIDEAMANIPEVIDICMEETPLSEINKFVGFREIEIKAAWVQSNLYYQIPKGLLQKIVREDLEMEMEEFIVLVQ